MIAKKIHGRLVEVRTPRKANKLLDGGDESVLKIDNEKELNRIYNTTIKSPIVTITPTLRKEEQGGNVESEEPGLYGIIGQGVTATGDMLRGISNINRTIEPLSQKLGLAYGGRLNKFGVGGDQILGAAQTGAELIGNAVQMAQTDYTDDQLHTAMAQAANRNVETQSSYDELEQDMENYREARTNLSGSDMRNNSFLNDFGASLSASGKGFSTGSQFGPWGAAIGGAVGGVSSVVGSVFGRKKARDQARQLNAAAKLGNERAQEQFATSAEQIAEKTRDNLLRNYAAEGGKISISPENRGSFTESATRAGMGVQEYAKHILANRDEYSPLQVKRANFARNSAKWHADGGPLRDVDGPIGDGPGPLGDEPGPLKDYPGPLPDPSARIDLGEGRSIAYTSGPYGFEILAEGGQVRRAPLQAVAPPAYDDGYRGYYRPFELGGRIGDSYGGKLINRFDEGGDDDNNPMIGVQQDTGEEVPATEDIYNQQVEKARRENPYDVYEVQRGDNLTRIAKSLPIQMTVEELARINKTNPDSIYPGQKLIYPKLQTEETADVEDQTPQWEEYEVKRGDSLSEIAKRYGQSADELARENGIKDANKIQAGQRIRIRVPNNKEEKTPQWVDWDDIVKHEEEINAGSDFSIINSVHAANGDGQKYIVVDKKNAKLYLCANGETIREYDIGLGRNSALLDDMPYQVTDKQFVSKDNKGGVNWGYGNMVTPAGLYFADLTFGYGHDSLMLRTKDQIDNGVKDGISTSIHYGPNTRENGSPYVSNGCVRLAEKDINDLTGRLKGGEHIPTYFLPVEEGNRFFVRNGELNFRSNDEVSNFRRGAWENGAYNGVPMAYRREEGDEQTDWPTDWWNSERTILEDGPFVKTTPWANHNPNTGEVTAGWYPVYKNATPGHYTMTTGIETKMEAPEDLELDKRRAGIANDYMNSIMENKGDLQKDLGINNDTYNSLARYAMGILNEETHYGNQNSWLGNVARSFKKLVGSGKSSGPDYVAEYEGLGIIPLADTSDTPPLGTTPTAGVSGYAGHIGGQTEGNIMRREKGSIGLTQINWHAIYGKHKNPAENAEDGMNKNYAHTRELFEKYDIKQEDLVYDPAKAAIATMIVLANNYKNCKGTENEELQKLPAVQRAIYWWNKSPNYRQRVIDEGNRYKVYEKHAEGGSLNRYSVGQEVELSDRQAKRLKKLGYDFVAI